MTLVASTTQYLSCILLQSKHPLPLLFCVKKSPLTVVQQFLSRVIRDGSWPLPLPSDLLENALQQALTTSASLYMRWELRLEGWDYQLLSLPFIPAAQAKKIVEMFLASPICCLPQGFSKKIFQIVKKTEISAAKNLLGPYWWQIFSIIAHRLTLSTLDVEATHSRHRHLCRSSHSTSIETLSAEACLQEALLVMKEVQEPSAKSKVANQQEGNDEKKRMSGKQLFHYLRLQVAPPCKWFTKEAWEKSNAMWDDMSAASRDAFNTLSVVPQNIAQKALYNRKQATAKDSETEETKWLAFDPQEEWKPNALIPSNANPSKSSYPLSTDVWHDISEMKFKRSSTEWDKTFQEPAPPLDLQSRPDVTCPKHLCKKFGSRRVPAYKRILALIAKTGQRDQFQNRFPLIQVQQVLPEVLHGEYYIMAHCVPSLILNF